MSSLKTPLGIVRIIIILIVLATTIMVQVFTGVFSPNWIFLFGSSMIVFLALVNFLEGKDDEKWSQFLLLMFIAMLVCSLADLLMAGVFAILPVDSLINGVLFFLLGHVIYILALRNISPLLFRSESPRLITRNRGESIVIALDHYGIFLSSSLLFSITKHFDDFPQLFSLCLIIGFFLFFVSDYILGLSILQGISFSGVEAVGVTYLLGQLIIHLSPMFKNKQ